MTLTLKFKDTTGLLPTDNFEIIADNVVVGFCQLRHTPSKSNIMPKNFESHLYYEIYQNQWNKGYATSALKLLIDKARQIGIKEIMATVADDNIASQKVLEKNTAILIDTQKASDNKNTLYRKYLIKLK